MQNRADIIFEYIKYVLALKASKTISKEEVTSILMEHGLSDTEIQFVIDAANIE